MKSEVYRDVAKLRECGYQIESIDTIARNAGSETLKHRIAKMCTAHILWSNGYHLASEVPIADRYADIIGLGHPTRMPIVVELETDATETDKELYRDYYGSHAVREVFTIDISPLPMNPHDQTRRLAGILGLSD